MYAPRLDTPEMLALLALLGLWAALFVTGEVLAWRRRCRRRRAYARGR
jgi:hypothetical protein